MAAKSKLLYKSNNTCFQTYLPVYFYGMSDGRIMVFYTRFITANPSNILQEWVVAIHNDFLYDFESDKILTADLVEIGIEEFMDLADNFDQRVKTIKTFGSFASNTDAQKYVNLHSAQMLSSAKPIGLQVENFYTDWQL